jgi:hypothetical protein
VNKLTYWILLFALLPSKQFLHGRFAYIFIFFKCKMGRTLTYSFSFCICFKVLMLWPDDDPSFRSKLVAI